MVEGRNIEEEKEENCKGSSSAATIEAAKLSHVKICITTVGISASTSAQPSHDATAANTDSVQAVVTAAAPPIVNSGAVNPSHRCCQGRVPLLHHLSLSSLRPATSSLSRRHRRVL
ncbi:hypothetical protein M0R45_035967 [Rubus argutus]|uniref:Uncharacterized protein n=1 Tax=Rubus argutus TaxID=59490 RepID=A0AAW1VVM7_RUBAR